MGSKSNRTRQCKSCGANYAASEKRDLRDLCRACRKAWRASQRLKKEEPK
jgi:hypothetical protein